MNQILSNRPKLVAPLFAATIFLAAAVSEGIGDTLGDARNSIQDAPESILENLSLSEKVAEYRALQQQLVQERRELAESLRDATPEERRDAVRQFQDDNSERLGVQRALAEAIRQEMQGQRPSLRAASDDADSDEGSSTGKGKGKGRPDHAGPPDTVLELIQDFDDTRKDIIRERREILERLREENATTQERQAAMAELREQQKEAIQEQREAAKAHKEERRNRIDNRRPN